jgi:histidyl-tRNA synthetase
LNVMVYPEPTKLPKQFKFADKLGIKAVLVVGPDEAAAGQVTIKNLLDGTQQVVARTEVVPAVRRILETG